MARKKDINVNYNYNVKKSGGYGLGKFLGDLIMTCITCGFWLIWVFIREMRR